MYRHFQKIQLSRFMKYEKGETISKVFQKAIKEPGKPNKIWLDMGSGFLQQIIEFMIARKQYRNLFNV